MAATAQLAQPAEPGSGITTRENIAKLLDVTPKYVKYLVDRGVLVPRAGQQFEIVPSIHAYIRFLRKDATQGGSRLTESRARFVLAKAEIAEFDRDERRGLLAPIDQIEETWLSVVGVMRAHLLTLPAKLSARITAAKTVQDVQDIVREEIYEALQILAKGTVESTLKDPGRPKPGHVGDNDFSDDGAAANTDDFSVG